MSCIVGIKHAGNVYVGADSCTSDQFSHTLAPASSKLFRYGSMLIGACGCPRAQQVLQYVFKAEEYDGKADPLEYLITKFALPLRQALSDHGAVRQLEKEDSGDTTEAWLIIGFQGRLFHLYGNFQIVEFDRDFDAEGSGGAIALGALHASARMDMKPEARIKLALEAAARFDNAVRAPFVIECI